MTGNLVNPGMTAPPSTSFEVTLRTADDFLIDQTLSNIFAEPELTAGPFLSASIASEGSIVGAESTFEANLELKSGLPA